MQLSLEVSRTFGAHLPQYKNLPYAPGHGHQINCWPPLTNRGQHDTDTELEQIRSGFNSKVKSCPLAWFQLQIYMTKHAGQVVQTAVCFRVQTYMFYTTGSDQFVTPSSLWLVTNSISIMFSWICKSILSWSRRCRKRFLTTNNVSVLLILMYVYVLLSLNQFFQYPPDSVTIKGSVQTYHSKQNSATEMYRLRQQ